MSPEPYHEHKWVYYGWFSGELLGDDQARVSAGRDYAPEGCLPGHVRVDRFEIFDYSDAMDAFHVAVIGYGLLPTDQCPVCAEAMLDME